jgi:cellulose synthase/poly-beta-1,6-N-acetylglucosamine synthase-like glycosyltransferase
VPLNPVRPLQILFIVFCAAIAVQLIYFIAFGIAFFRKRTTKETAPLPVSVIVCAHDEEVNLQTLIPALLCQDYPEFEVIIVDDRSNDSTFDMLLAETQKDHRLRMVHVNRTPPHVNGKKYGITLGIKAARFEWIILTDADCRPEGNQWLRTMSSEFAPDKQFVLGHSPYLKLAGFLNLFVRFESLLTAIQYLSFALLGNPYMGVGRNMAYRRSLFMEAKGFNNLLHITGGDDDLFVNQHARGANTAVNIAEGSRVYSVPETTWMSFFRQKIRHLSVGKHYKFSHKFLLGLFALSWLVTWFAGIPLLIFSPGVYWVAGALVIRCIVMTIILRNASKKLGQPFESWAVFLLDFIYAFYYLVTGLVALLTRKVRWKN